MHREQKVRCYRKNIIRIFSNLVLDLDSSDKPSVRLGNGAMSTGENLKLGCSVGAFGRGWVIV